MSFFLEGFPKRELRERIERMLNICASNVKSLKIFSQTDSLLELLTRAKITRDDINFTSTIKFHKKLDFLSIRSSHDLHIQRDLHNCCPQYQNDPTLDHFISVSDEFQNTELGCSGTLN